MVPLRKQTACIGLLQQQVDSNVVHELCPLHAGIILTRPNQTKHCTFCRDETPPSKYDCNLVASDMQGLSSYAFVWNQYDWADLAPVPYNLCTKCGNLAVEIVYNHRKVQQCVLYHEPACLVEELRTIIALYLFGSIVQCPLCPGN